MLIAALCGLAIALVSGTVRIVQLRRSLRANADTEGFKHPREK
jgi:uncharacterized integral membrane protein